MPHCIVEHSVNLDAKPLLKAVYDGAFASGLFEVDGSGIKVRLVPIEDYIAGNDKLSFIHVQLRILSGRYAEQKLMLSNLVLTEIKRLNVKDCSITIEVAELNRASYLKFLV